MLWRLAESQVPPMVDDTMRTRRDPPWGSETGDQSWGFNLKIRAGDQS